MNEREFSNRVAIFLTAIQDMYKGEDEREAFGLSKLELTDETLTDDFTAMIYAVYMFFRRITKEDMDIIDFVGVINRLVIQHIFGKSEKIEK